VRPAHGGSLDPQTLDFSASVNPLGPPDAVRAVLARAEELALRYPSVDADELCAALAKHHGVPEACVLAGNGSAELIWLVAQSLRGERVWLARPCFGEYEAACAALGVELVDDPARASASFAASPTSPQGALVDPAALLALPGVRVIDEAFMGFTDERTSLVARAAQDPAVIVLRSLTKLYALPGLRIGYLVAHPDWVDLLRGYQPPWSVNALAQAAGVAALADPAYLERTRAHVAALRAELATGLAALGLASEPSHANYLLCRVPSARALCAGLLRRGIAARDCTSFGGLEPDRFVRFAVRPAGENARLLGALRELVA
jgi:threonine-phosphate decarboxylase